MAAGHPLKVKTVANNKRNRINLTLGNV